MAEQGDLFPTFAAPIVREARPALAPGTLALDVGLTLPHTLDASSTVHAAFQVLTAYRRAWRWHVEAAAGMAHWGAQLRALLGDRAQLDIMGWQVTRLPDGSLHVSYDVQTMPRRTRQEA